MADIFPFEKLPPELRVAIYEYAFGTGETVTICRRQTTPAEYASESRSLLKDATWSLKAFIKVQTKDPRFTKTVSFSSKHSASLLRTSKLIYGEALPVLYSKRTFVFNNLSLQQFATECKTGTRYIQRIELTLKGGLRPALAALTDIPRLQRLEIFTPFCACLDLGRYRGDMNKLIQGVKRFVKLGGTQREMQRRFDVLVFTVLVSCSHNWSSYVSSYVKVSAVMHDLRVSEIRATVAEALMQVKAMKKLGVVFT